MIAWLAKFDIRFYCKQCTEVMRTINLKKNGIKAINNSSVLETKTSSQLQESMQAPFSWWPDTGFLQALKGGISPDYSPAAALLWQQWFLILFPFCIIFVPLQPPTKRINHTTIINTAGQRVLVVGVVLAEGTSGPSPTVLQFTVNIPKTGFFNFILRYKVRLQLIQVSLCFCHNYTWMHTVKWSHDWLTFYVYSQTKQPPKMGRLNGCLWEFIHRGSLPPKDLLKHIDLHFRRASLHSISNLKYVHFHVVTKQSLHIVWIE